MNKKEAQNFAKTWLPAWTGNQPEFLAAVRQNSDYLLESLHDALPSSVIKDVRGAGMLVGVEMVMPVGPIMPAAAANGLLVINAGENVLRLAPPLIVNREQIDTAVSIIGDIVET